MMYFNYGREQIDYLSSKDKTFACAIKQIGHINREIDTDLFVAVIHQIIAQQISTKAQSSIFQRLKKTYLLTPRTIASISPQELKQIGISQRKASYIIDFAQKTQAGSFDIKKISSMPDEKAIQALCTLKGVGIWSAQMVLLFCLQRQNVFSFDDLALKRGLCVLYGYDTITKQIFDHYKQLFSPYCSVASLYLWQIRKS